MALFVAVVVAELAYIAPSSTYRLRSWWTHLSVISRRSVVYKAERMGGRGNPYGVLCWMWNRSNVWLPILRDAVCCVRNDLVHFLTDAGKPLSHRTSTARSGLRLSKKPDMSNIRRAEM